MSHEEAIPFEASAVYRMGRAGWSRDCIIDTLCITRAEYDETYDREWNNGHVGALRSSVTREALRELCLWP